MDESTDFHKCAPGVKSNNLTCYSTKLLESMIKAYNKSHEKDVIVVPQEIQKMKAYNPTTYKQRIYKLIKDKLVVEDDTKWMTEPILKNMAKEDVIEAKLKTFKPTGPKDYTWLSNFDITKVMLQYEQYYPTFKFLGAYPRDFDSLSGYALSSLDWTQFSDKGKTKLGIIFNHDTSQGRGSHWVSFYCDLEAKCIYYFDSVGQPPKKEVQTLIKAISEFMKNPVIKINTVAHQHGDSECGVYSVSFLLRILDGEQCDDIFNNPISDEEIHKYRKKIFR